MLVKNWMSKHIITVDADDSMQHASDLMKEHKIRMLPVLKDGELVGILSDTDIKRASASDATTLDVHELMYLLSRVKVKDIMTRDPVTVPPDFTIEETAELLMLRKISEAPVVDENGEVVGVITQDDLFRVLISFSGHGRSGVQFALRVEDRPGSIKELTDLIREYSGRIASILSTYERAPEGYRNVYIRAYGIDRSKMLQLQKSLQDKALLLYIVDHLENKRLIFRE